MKLYKKLFNLVREKSLNGVKNLKTDWLVKHTITVFSCVLIIVLGIAAITYADSVTTTIGENISTNSLTATGLTVDTDTLYVDSANNRVGIGTMAPTSKLSVDGSVYLDNGNLLINKVAITGAPTATINDIAGNLNGIYYYAVTFVTAIGETTRGSAVSVSPINQCVNLTNIPVSSDSHVIARNIYRTVGNPADQNLLQFLATINDNTTTIYEDNVADGSLGIAIPYFNTTSGNISVNGSRVVAVDGLSASFGAYSMLSGTGYANSAFGGCTLYNNTSGLRNVALGADSLFSNTTGNRNTAGGVHSLNDNVNGSDNTAFGYSAAFSSTAGMISAFGSGALQANTTGGFNSAFGTGTLSFNTTGSANTAIGLYSLRSNLTGSNNVAVGFYAGHNSGTALQTNTNSIFLGTHANSSVDGLTNAIAIGSASQVTKSNQIVLGNAGITETLLRGTVGIGTTNPVNKLHVEGTGSGSAGIYLNNAVPSSTTSTLYNNSGNLYWNGTDLSDGSSKWTAGAGDDIYRLNGNIGIGTTNPLGKLQIGDSGGADNSLILFAETSAANAGSELSWNMNVGGGNANSVIAAIVPEAYKTGLNKNTMDFYVGAWNNNNDKGSMKMTITSSGNVGIGTTSPDTKLDVDGIIKTAPRSTATCDSNSEGGIYYDSDDNHFYGCNGSAWVQLDN